MKKSISQETVTFYDVPLVCGAAPSIGCGSRAKPLLLDLERQSAIKEVWLNRTGTIVAIVWHDEPHMEEAGKPIFKRHEVEYNELRGDKPDSLRIDEGWFRGAEVDHLSLEEAREIAETLVALVGKERLTSIEEAAQIKSDIEHYFRKELIKIRTKQELLHDTQDKFRKAVLNIFQKHVGTERASEVQARIQNPFAIAEKAETSSCC